MFSPQLAGVESALRSTVSILGSGAEANLDYSDDGRDRDVGAMGDSLGEHLYGLLVRLYVSPVRAFCED
jgi:hypothetical protein